MTRLNVTDIETYLSFLAPNPTEIFAFAFLDEHSKHQIPGLGVKFANRATILAFLQSSEPDGKLWGIKYTLHVALNHTSTAGRKASDVKSVRVLCLELDNLITKEKLYELIESTDVHLIVESSPGKYHVYWKIDPSIPLKNWSEYQLGLAHMYGGDYAISQLSHTIRVPGIERYTKSGALFIPRIAWMAASVAQVSEQQVGVLFPNIAKAAAQAKAEQKRIRETLRRNVREGKPITAQGLGRNRTLYEAVVEWVSELHYDENGHVISAPSIDDAMQYGNEIAAGFEVKASDPFTQAEIDKTVVSAYQTGVEKWASRKEIAENIGGLLTPVSPPDGEKLFTRAPAVKSTVIGTIKIDNDANNLKAEILNGTHSGTNGFHPEGVKNEGDPHEPLAIKLSRYEPFKYNYDEPILRIHRFSDMGVTARVLQRFGQRLVMVGEQLYAFDEDLKTWRPQSSRSHPQVYSFLQQVCLDVIHDPLFVQELCTKENNDISDTMARRAKDRFTAGRLHSMVVQDVFNSPSVNELPKESFDAKEHLLYVGNGVLNMLTGHVRDAKAADYLLNRATVAWDTKAECPRWMKFIKEIFAAATDPLAMCMFMQELFGYSLSGSMNEQKLFLHHGDGSNGKSYLLSALAKLLGTYATYLEPAELVRAKNGFDTKFERFGAKIEGKRVAIVDDVDVKAVWNEGTVKNLTADTLRARAEYERSRVVMNRTKLHLGLNVAPIPEAENYGILRRLCFIPYGVRFAPDGKKGRELDKMLKEELPGILRWAVDGYRRYHERGGLEYPADSQIASKEYQDEHFSIEAVIEELFERIPEGSEETPLFLTDIADDVNKSLGGAGRVESRAIAPILKRKFGVVASKIWNPDKRNSQRAVNLRLKIPRPQAGDLL